MGEYREELQLISNLVNGKRLLYSKEEFTIIKKKRWGGTDSGILFELSKHPFGRFKANHHLVRLLFLQRRLREEVALLLGLHTIL